jgi:glycosyltransferase involved in cell wall biosynthesis
MAPGGKLLERLLMPKSIKKADKIICVSHSTQQDLAESFPDAEGKSCVIYEAPCTKPVPEEIFAQPESPFFLFVGTKEPRKNLHNCLVAWQQSQLSKAGFKLIIAGGRGWNFSLGDSIQLTGSAASVIDAQPSEVELRKLYATCHALIMPSLYEGFGLPLVEAMAFGKPMITSNVSSMPEIAGDAAIYVTADKVAELSKAFLTLAQNSELHNRLSKNAAKRATLFGWEKAVDQSLEVIIEAAGR